MLDVKYRVIDDDFTGVVVAYDDETGYTHSACCRIGLFGSVTKDKKSTVKYLCNILGIVYHGKETL